MNNEDKRTKQIVLNLDVLRFLIQFLLLSYCYLIYFILTLK